MNNPAAKPETNPATTSNNNTPKVESSRNLWIYTGYVGAALALLGVLAYHFSTYVVR